MNSRVERGRDISVLVEQAFPTCILVSFQHGAKTFRGVLLDESSKTSVIRATSSDGLGKADNPANLGLTTSRATTCQSDLQHLPSGRVNTRSSAMMLRDGREGAAVERVTTPGSHKIRDIVERLSQRPSKLAPKPQPGNENSSPKDHVLKQDEITRPSVPQPASTLINGRKENTSIPVKRKRTNEDSEPPVKAAKTTHGDSDISKSVDKKETKIKPVQQVIATRHNQSNKITSPLSGHGKSPLFPILKLKRTSGLLNSYVAVTMFGPVETKVKDTSVQNSTDTQECTKESTTEKSRTTTLSQEEIDHRHNTRFRGKRTTEVSEPQSPSPPPKLASEVKLSPMCNSAEIIKEEELTPNVHTKNHVRVQTQLNINTTSKAKQLIVQRKRNPRMIHRNLKVGDIAWGKVHGHPWWPCRVFAASGSEFDGSYQIVKVTWYGSPTTSNISCGLLLAFKEHFKHLYKKHKKGKYQLAVREAQQDLELCFSRTQVIPA